VSAAAEPDTPTDFTSSADNARTPMPKKVNAGPFEVMFFTGRLNEVCIGTSEMR
jgi:hypothetical protein